MAEENKLNLTKLLGILGQMEEKGIDVDKYLIALSNAEADKEFEKNNPEEYKMLKDLLDSANREASEKKIISVRELRKNAMDIAKKKLKEAKQAIGAEVDGLKEAMLGSLQRSTEEIENRQQDINTRKEAIDAEVTKLEDKIAKLKAELPKDIEEKEKKREETMARKSVAEGNANKLKKANEKNGFRNFLVALGDEVKKDNVPNDDIKSYISGEKKIPQKRGFISLVKAARATVQMQTTRKNKEIDAELEQVTREDRVIIGELEKELAELKLKHKECITELQKTGKEKFDLDLEKKSVLGRLEDLSKKLSKITAYGKKLEEKSRTGIVLAKFKDELADIVGRSKFNNTGKYAASKSGDNGPER